MKLRSHRLNWKDIHITGVNIDNLNNIYKRDWNFEHLHDRTKMLLDAEPDKDMFMLGIVNRWDDRSVQSVDESNRVDRAPIIVSFQVPKGTSL